jgi:purine-binding chemotaxis protein CheW
MNKPDMLTQINLNTGLPDQERVEQIWAKRAAQFAQIEAHEAPGKYRHVALIRLGGELFGLEVTHISEVQPVEELTQVPRVPAWVAGITNLRGQFLSVIDLAKYLGLSAETDRENGCLVVIQHQKIDVIFLVDEVTAVEMLREQNMLSGDMVVHHLPKNYVRAVVESRDGASEQRFIAVLDVEGLLSDQHFIIHEL